MEHQRAAAAAAVRDSDKPGVFAGVSADRDREPAPVVFVGTGTQVMPFQRKARIWKASAVMPECHAARRPPGSGACNR